MFGAAGLSDVIKNPITARLPTNRHKERIFGPSENRTVHTESAGESKPNPVGSPMCLISTCGANDPSLGSAGPQDPREHQSQQADQ